MLVQRFASHRKRYRRGGSRTPPLFVEISLVIDLRQLYFVAAALSLSLSLVNMIF